MNGCATIENVAAPTISSTAIARNRNISGGCVRGAIATTAFSGRSYVIVSVWSGPTTHDSPTGRYPSGRTWRSSASAAIRHAETVEPVKERENLGGSFVVRI